MERKLDSVVFGSDWVSKRHKGSITYEFVDADRSAPAVSAAFFARGHGIADLWRCLCRGNAGSADCRRVHLSRSVQRSDRALQALLEALLLVGGEHPCPPA